MRKLSAIYERIESSVLMTFFGVMGIILFAQVFFRYVLNMPLAWSEELARFLQVWITFFGIGFGLRHDSHVAMTLVFNKCPRHVQLVLGMLCNIVLIICLLKLLPAAHQYAEYQFKILSSSLRIPKGFVFVAIPMASYILIGYLVRSVVSSVSILVRERS